MRVALYSLTPGDIAPVATRVVFRCSLVQHVNGKIPRARVMTLLETLLLKERRVYPPIINNAVPSSLYIAYVYYHSREFAEFPPERDSGDSPNSRFF